MAVVIIAANAVVIAGAADSGGVRPGDGVGAGGKHRAHGRVGEAVILRAEHLIASGTLHGAPGQHRLAAVIQLQRRDLRRVHGGRRLAVPAGRLTEVAVRAAADGAYLIVIPGVGLGGGILVERDVRRHDKGIGGSGRGAAVGGGLCAPDLVALRTGDGGPPDGGLAVAAILAQRHGGHIQPACGLAGAVERRVQQRVVAVSHGDGQPLRRRAAVVHVGQAAAGAERPTLNSGETAGQVRSGHGDAAGERNNPNGLHALREPDLLQRAAHGEGLPLNTGHAGGNGHTGQLGAVFEHAVSDDCQVSGQSHVCQLIALIEQHGSQLRTVGQLDGCQVRVTKCAVSNGGDAAGDGQGL